MFPRQITARVVPTLTNKTVGVWMADTPNGAGKAWPAPHMNTLPPGSVANVYQVRFCAASMPQFSFWRHASSPEFCGSDSLFTQQTLTAEHEDGRSAAGSRCRCSTLHRRIPMVYVQMFPGRTISILVPATLSFSVTLTRTHCITVNGYLSGGRPQIWITTQILQQCTQCGRAIQISWIAIPTLTAVPIYLAEACRSGARASMPST